MPRPQTCDNMFNQGFEIAVDLEVWSNIYDAKKYDAKLMLNLGDILYRPITPMETYDRFLSGLLFCHCSVMDH